MNKTEIYYSLFLLAGVFASSISQVMLKKAALKKYDSKIKEYLNPLVFFAYVIFVGTTISMGPVLEATSYIYITIWGVTIFKEKINFQKLMALVLIIIGIAVYSICG